MKDLAKEVAEADERARSGRIERLTVLRSGPYVEHCPMPALAYEYYEEARLCWFAGAFVAAILMVQLTFEEFLRSLYRAARGVGGKLDSGVLVDRSGFADLIQQGRRDGFLTPAESNRLVALKDERNPYVHTKDRRSRSPTFFDQLAKISVPEIVGVGVEHEAKKAIELLITLFPTLCQRM